MYDPEFIKALFMAQRGKPYAIGGTVTGPSVNYRPGQNPAAPIPAAPAAPAGGTIRGPGGVPGGSGRAPGAAPAGAPGIAPAHSFDGMPFQNPFQAQVPTSNQQFNPGQFSGTVTGAQQSLGGLAQMLQQRAAGTGGPSVADQQLQQTTQNNVANAFASAAALGGNNAAAARNAVNAGAAMNQQAAGQASIQRAQEQMAAQDQLRQLGLGQLGTAGSLMTDQQKLALEQAQGNQAAALNAQGLNAGVSAQNQAIASGQLTQGAQIASGLLNGAGAAAAHWAQPSGGQGVQTAGGAPSDVTWSNPDAPPAQSGSTDYFPPGATPTAGSYDWQPPTYAHGGLVGALVRRYAAGGGVPYNYELASQVADPRMANLLGNGAPSFGSALMAGSGAAGGAKGRTKEEQTVIDAQNGVGTALNFVPVVGPLASKAWNAAAQAQRDGWTPSQIFDPGLKGQDPTHYDPKYGDKLNGGAFNGDTLSRGVDNGIYDAGQWFKGVGDTIGSWFHANGGPVPGAASKPGNSLKNDTVPAMLSPGEIVLPRSVTLAPDPVGAAADFVAAIKKQKPAQGPKSYGELLKRHQELQARVDALEGK